MNHDMGGPAFPTPETLVGGITLWDFYASQFQITDDDLPGSAKVFEELIGEPIEDTDAVKLLEQKARMLAIIRATYADAMIAERAKRIKDVP